MTQIKINCPRCGEQLLFYTITQLNGTETTFKCMNDNCGLYRKYNTLTCIHALEMFQKEIEDGKI